MNLDESVSCLKGVGDKKSKLLSKLGINSLRDLLYYMPRDYDLSGKRVPVSELKPDGLYIITAVIKGNTSAGCCLSEVKAL